MKETLSSMASRLGVSVSTVSRVLAGKAAQSRIPKATEDRVMDEARRCGYGVNLFLGKRRSGMIGLVLPSLSNPFFAEMAHVAISSLRVEGYSAIVVDTMEDEKVFDESVSSLVSRQVDGILVVPSGTNPDILEDIEKNGVPVVLIDRYYADAKLSYVTTDNYRGGIDATRYLINKGHRRIVCIKGVETSLPNSERLRGYEFAMEEAGLGELISSRGNDFTVQNGYAETLELIRSGERPTAIFALGNTIAMGAIKAIREDGLQIPQDISVITFDNNMYLDYMTPSVVRVSQPVNKMTIIATKMLLDKIRGEFSGESHLKFAPTIIQGDSVKAL